MGEGYRIMQNGIKDMIFTKASHKDGDELALELTREFIWCFRKVTENEVYQNDFDTYVLKAMILHYERSLKIPKADQDSDRMSGIACLLVQLKDRLGTLQTSISNYDESKPL